MDNEPEILHIVRHSLHLVTMLKLVDFQRARRANSNGGPRATSGPGATPEWPSQKAEINREKHVVLAKRNS